MATVTYDDRSFLIDGKRVWLVSGSVHYFRVPAALWRDRLIQAKRAGLNCISTCVPWNYHEGQEGQWDLTGDKDVAAFVRLAGELGLYVILRPGPYIGVEWDSGGIPGWLSAKSGVGYRTNSAAFTHYYDKFFRQVLPPLAELQVSRGGNIVLIQAENEYVMTTMPDRLAYLEFINQLFRRSGFDIPIITCNNFSDPAVPHTIECVNGWGNEVQLLKRMRLRQPNCPLLMSEFRAGALDRWGRGPHQATGAPEVARRAMEILGCGAQYNYYMWHGGTNFGFWGGRLSETDDAYPTASYDYDAPLAEGGVRTPKYYLTRVVNMLANHMGRFFASCILEQPGVSIHDSTDVMNLSGGLCNWAIVTNNGRDEITSAEISLPEGQQLTVPLAPFGAAAIPVELDLTSSQMLDYANLTPLGFFGEKVLVLHGPGGWEARISINGREVVANVPASSEPVLVEHEGIVLVLINTDAAMRTWQVEDSLIIGPDFVGETLEDIIDAPSAKTYAMLSLEDGKLTHIKAGGGRRRKPNGPTLSTWKRVGLSLEPTGRELEWRKTAPARDVDQLGAHYGYVWYRIEIERGSAGSCNLFLPDCEDRAGLFLNGKPLATWGRGDGAVRETISADFKKGANVLTVLTDNLGRFSSGPRLGQRKGLFGHVYDAKPLRTSKFKLTELDGFARRVIPRQQAHLLDELRRCKVWAAETTLSLASVAAVHVSFRDIPHHVAVLCNDRPAGFFARGDANFGDVTLGSSLQKGKNTVRLLLWGDVDAKTLQKVRFHLLRESLSQGAKWSWRPWERPDANNASGRSMPAWYSTTFKYTPHDCPLFLRIGGSRKGQVFVNGHNLGRFWTIGPQQYHYLPSCWLAESNELVLFDEQGKSPSPSRLEYLPAGPFG